MIENTHPQMVGTSFGGRHEVHSSAPDVDRRAGLFMPRLIRPLRLRHTEKPESGI